MAALSPDQRRSLREAVAADLAFDSAFDNPTFEFAFPRLDPMVKAAALSLFSSISEDVFGASGFRLTEVVVSRESWERSFRAANPKVAVCPACVSAPLPGPIRGRSLVDADHYLPKSKYPALAVHGLNLVLLCKPCNQILKGSLDPLLDRGEPVRLDEIWFPYRRAGIGELVIGFNFGEKVTVTLGGSPPARERARRFDRLFALLERWSETVARIAEVLPSTLLIQTGGRLEEEAIREGLEILKQMDDADIAVEDRAFIRSRYIGWLLDTPDAFHSLVDEMKSVDYDPDG